ncbi:MAG: response regulator [Gemmatimonadetes bacterium]|nr:response regulator [Gemmatimonadota bacterium]
MTGPDSPRARRTRGLRYLAIADDLRRRIQSGEFTHGERLPSQPSLARQYGVSLTTFRTALSLLTDEGYLHPAHGLGTFVANPEDQRLHALVVDDDPATIQLFQSILSEANVRVTPASSGREALERVAHNRFDIIFLDLVMPHGDGVHTLGRFRSMHLSTPVVVVTGEADADMIARAMAHGPLTLIIKPVRPPQVRELLGSLPRPGPAGSAQPPERSS